MDSVNLSEGDKLVLLKIATLKKSDRNAIEHVMEGLLSSGCKCQSAPQSPPDPRQKEN